MVHVSRAGRNPCLFRGVLPAGRSAKGPLQGSPDCTCGHPIFKASGRQPSSRCSNGRKESPNLIATPDEAEALVSTIRANAPKLVDPDFQLHDIRQLAMVKGENRTSVIVEPDDGRMPFTRGASSSRPGLPRATRGSSTRMNGGRSRSAASRTSGTRRWRGSGAASPTDCPDTRSRRHLVRGPPACASFTSGRCRPRT